MSVLDTQPSSANFLNPQNFDLRIKKCPNIVWYTQRVIIPNIDNPATAYPNPLVALPETGDHIIYQPLLVTFKVAEDLANYLEIFNWLTALGFPEDSEQFAAIQNVSPWLGTGIRSDISVFICNSNQVPKFEVLFKDAFPTLLTGFPLNSVDSTVNYVTCEATFAYAYFTVSAIPG